MLAGDDRLLAQANDPVRPVDATKGTASFALPEDA
jgi:hypothetical protein